MSHPLRITARLNPIDERRCISMERDAISDAHDILRINAASFFATLPNAP